jgi:hypothetical protein
MVQGDYSPNSFGEVSTSLQGQSLPIGDHTLSQRLRGIRRHLTRKGVIWVFGWLSEGPGLV